MGGFVLGVSRRKARRPPTRRAREFRKVLFRLRKPAYARLARARALRRESPRDPIDTHVLSFTRTLAGDCRVESKQRYVAFESFARYHRKPTKDAARIR